MQQQEQTCWCWAAIACSISAFFNPTTLWTQCKPLMLHYEVDELTPAPLTPNKLIPLN